MLSALRKRIFTPAGVIAVIALVFAMVGGAFAAGGGLSGKQKKEVEKISKKFAGKPGANGATGPAGANGTNGKDGTNGTNGAPGKGVVIGNATAGECSAGGKTVEVEGSGAKNKVCNGSPWTAGGTLPSGATETGIWAFGPITAAATSASNLTFAPLASFSIPLAAPLSGSGCEEEMEPCQVHYINASGEEVVKFNGAEEVTVPPTACLGSVETPTAQAGNLCVYAGAQNHVQIPSAFIANPATSTSGAGKAGAVGVITITGAEAFARGTWAVTG